MTILLSSLFALPTVASAQLCDGDLNVVLLAARDTIDLAIDSATYEPAQFGARRLVSRDGVYAVTVMPRHPDYYHPTAILRMPLHDRAGFVARTGCGNDLGFTITRSGASGRVDTMVLDAVNACDLYAMATIEFVPGRFDLLVCDTMRYPAEEASIEGYRYVHMPYVGSHYPGSGYTGALDATISLTRDDPAVAADTAASSVIIRLLDRARRPIDVAGIDVRVRQLADPRINPRFARHHRRPARELLRDHSTAGHRQRRRLDRSTLRGRARDRERRLLHLHERQATRARLSIRRLEQGRGRSYRTRRLRE